MGDASINFGRPDGRTQDMIAGIRGHELDTFIAGHGVRGCSSPFRRLTTAHEDFASYIHAPAVKRAASAPSFRAHARLNDIEERTAKGVTYRDRAAVYPAPA